MTTTPSRRVAVLVFADAEVLDVAGPYEVFSIAGRRHGLSPFEVSLVAERPGPVALGNGFVVTPHSTLADAPQPDILVVPGGTGTRREIHNAGLIAWIRQVSPRAELVLSVCTGALLLGTAGLLDGLESTTRHDSYALLKQVAPTTRVREGERFIDNGRIVVAAGVSAGIDMSLHVVERLLGPELAEEAALYMEYHWDRNEEGLTDQGI